MKKDEKDQNENTIDLTFCFESIVILEEAINKLNYIGSYTISNSKSAMSKSIGQQIDYKLRNQQELEKEFEDLIIERSRKTELVEEKEIIALTKKIEEHAGQLKESVNNICKSLDENPDIPANLLKAEQDQRLIIEKLSEIKKDFVYGQTKKFNEIIEDFESQSINIEDLRKVEMSNFKILKKLNEDLQKEDDDYNHDKNEMNQRLFNKKKILANTKLEENMFSNYRENQIRALENLTRNNFGDDEKKMGKDIDEKTKEKDKMTELSGHVLRFYKGQIDVTTDKKAEWDKKAGDKGKEREDVNRELEEANKKKSLRIKELDARIGLVDAGIKHLEEVAPKLNTTNYATIHPVLPEKLAKGEKLI